MELCRQVSLLVQQPLHKFLQVTWFLRVTGVVRSTRIVTLLLSGHRTLWKNGFPTAEWGATRVVNSIHWSPVPLVCASEVDIAQLGRRMVQTSNDHVLVAHEGIQHGRQTEPR